MWKTHTLCYAKNIACTRNYLACTQLAQCLHSACTALAQASVLFLLAEKPTGAGLGVVFLPEKLTGARYESKTMFTNLMTVGSSPLVKA